MDEFGQCDTADAFDISQILDQNGSVFFAFAPGNMTSYNVLISADVFQYGVTSHGGQSRGRVFVGVQGVGMNHFAPQETHPSYFVEKLKIDQEFAEAFSKLWKEIWNKF